MVKKTEDKSVSQTPATSVDITAMSAMQPEQSWGEKYKHGTFNFIRNILVNYIINFMLAASFTFAVDTTKVGTWLRGLIDKGTEGITNPARKEVSKFVLNFMTRTQLLLCGGHVLLPVLKWMKDHQKRLEFRIGHTLDSLQELLGRGNAASHRSMEEYDRVSSLVSIGDHNRKESDEIAVPELSEKDKILLDKYHVNKKLQFTDKKVPWSAVLKARLIGMLFTTLTSIGLSVWSKYPKIPVSYRFQTHETRLGKILGDKVIARIPIVSRVFRKLPNAAGEIAGRDNISNGHQLIGEYFIDDAIYTAMSKLGFDLMEARHERREKKEQEATSQQELSADEKLEALKEKSLKRKITEGPRDHRTRVQDSKTAQPIALS